MKVTQEEFDVKRKELSEVQDKFDETLNDMFTLLKRQEYLQDWLQDAEIEKDLSVDVANTYHPFYVIKDGRYENKGYLLHPDLDWEIKPDNQGYSLLIPTKKP